jgi:FkbM family methyltransferase
LKIIEHFAGHALYTPAVTKDSIVIDLGANRGAFTDEMVEAFRCDVVLVEPNPEFLHDLEKPGRRVFSLAIGATDGIVSFNIANNSEGSSVLPLPSESQFGATLREAITVPSMSLRTFVEQLDVTHIDVLKLDIEGAETAALASLSDEMLMRIGQITVEFHDDPRFHFGIHDEVMSTIARLKGLGFTYLQFNRPRTTNALFIGPAIGLSAAARAWIKARFDVFRAVRHLPLRFRQA